MLGGAGALALAGAAFAVGGCSSSPPAKAGSAAATTSDVLAFDGPYQAGILTPPQQRIVFAAFDLLAADRAALQSLLRQWTAAARLLTAGRPVGPVEPANAAQAPVDTGEALELSAANLTITVGLGRSVFVDAAGHDRLGLAAPAPRAARRASRVRRRGEHRPDAIRR